MKTLVDLRTMRNLSRKQVAKYIGVKENTYARYERRIPNMHISIAYKLSHVLGITIDELAELYKTNT